MTTGRAGESRGHSTTPRHLRGGRLGTHACVHWLLVAVCVVAVCPAVATPRGVRYTHGESGDTLTFAPGIYDTTLVIPSEWRNVYIRGTSAAEVVLRAGQKQSTSNGIVIDKVGAIDTFVVEDLTIMNGGVSTECIESQLCGGAGLRIAGKPYGGDVVVRRCVFDGNVVGDEAAGYGGAVRCSERDRVVIEDCEFRNNYGIWGGAIGVDAPIASIRRCRIEVPAYADGVSAIQADVGYLCIESCDITDGGLSRGFGIVANGLAVQVLGNSCIGCGGAAEWRVKGRSPNLASIVMRDNVCIAAQSGRGSEIGFVDELTVENNTWVNQRVEIVQGAPSTSFIRRNVVMDGMLTLSCPGLTNISCNVTWPMKMSASCAIGADNVVADPLFCAPSSGDFHVDGRSPCAPENSLGCGVIGALPVGCANPAVDRVTWGRVKSMFGSAGGRLEP